MLNDILFTFIFQVRFSVCPLTPCNNIKSVQPAFTESFAFEERNPRVGRGFTARFQARQLS
jgi:hypothetical protein